MLYSHTQERNSEVRCLGLVSGTSIVNERILQTVMQREKPTTNSITGPGRSEPLWCTMVDGAAGKLIMSWSEKRMLTTIFRCYKEERQH